MSGRTPHIAPATDTARRDGQRISPALLWLVLGLIMAAGIAAWVAITRFGMAPADRPGAMMALANASLALAFGGVLGGVIGQIFAEFSRLRDARLAREDFIRNILADLKSVIDGAETARLLIDAHRSAKTYGEQMRRLPDFIMTLRNIQRALRPGFRDLELELTLPLDRCIAFLEALLDEYRDRYKQVSRLQSIDEAIEHALRQSIAADVVARLDDTDPATVARLRDDLAREATPDDPSMTAQDATDDATDSHAPRHLSNAAWSRIETFPRLNDLRQRDGGMTYKTGFLDPMDLASYVLRARLPGGERRENSPNMEARRRDTIETTRARLDLKS